MYHAVPHQGSSRKRWSESTRDSFADALRELSGPQAFRSNYEGAFGPGKN